jgi:hypothetical protein
MNERDRSCENDPLIQQHNRAPSDKFPFAIDNITLGRVGEEAEEAFEHIEATFRTGRALRESNV